MAAANKGYGMAIHPEYYFGGPYGNPRWRGGKSQLLRARGGSYDTAALNGYGYNTAALDGFGYNTAALDGFGYNTAALDGFGYNTAALDGFGYNTAALDGFGYNTAALYGYGMGEILTEMADAIGPAAMKVLETLAKRFSTSVMNLLRDPEKLISLLSDYAPKVAQLVKKFFNWIKTKQQQVTTTTQKINQTATKILGEEPKDTLTRYMRLLKQQDPVAYQNIYREMQRVKWAQQNLQKERPFKI